jgi:type VI protein secretion system component Hcp
MAVDIFLKLGDIKGEIDVLGWRWGMSQSGHPQRTLRR